MKIQIFWIVWFGVFTLLMDQGACQICNSYPGDTESCIHRTLLECRWNSFQNACEPISSRNFGCDSSLNKISCISQLQEPNGRPAKCYFGDRCQDAKPELLESITCSHLLSKYACTSVVTSGIQCVWKNEMCSLKEETKEDLPKAPVVKVKIPRCFLDLIAEEQREAEEMIEEETQSSQSDELTNEEGDEGDVSTDGEEGEEEESEEQNEEEEQEASEEQFIDHCLLSQPDSVNAQVCASLPLEYPCFHGDITNQNKCKQIEPHLLSEQKCDLPGLNQNGCLKISEKTAKCIFENGKCQQISNDLFIQLECSSNVNQLGCLSITNPNQPCKWEGEKCLLIQDQNVQCETLTNVSVSACLGSKEACIYDTENNSCRSPRIPPSIAISNDKTKYDSCDSLGLSQYGCFQFNSACRYDEGGICQSLTTELLNFFTCDANLNQLACISLTTPGQTCKWDEAKRQCYRYQITQKDTCVNQKLVNGNFCKTITNGRCKYNPEISSCVESENNDFCQTPNINIEGCVSITRQNAVCQWDQQNQLCKDIQVVSGVTKCTELQNVNAAACSQVYRLDRDLNARNCKYSPFNRSCLSFKVGDKSYDCNVAGLNLFGCVNVSQVGQRCQWTGTNCRKIKQSDVQSFECISLKTVNAASCALIVANNDRCKYEPVSHNCIPTVNEKTDTCETLGLNAFGCSILTGQIEVKGELKQVNCSFDSTRFLCYSTDSLGEEGSLDYLNKVKCFGDFTTKFNCLKITTIKETCRWDLIQDLCVYATITNKDQCATFPTLVNRNVCSAVNLVLPDISSQSYCKYQNGGCVALEESDRNAPCSLIGLNIHACNAMTSNVSYCYFQNETQRCKEFVGGKKTTQALASTFFGGQKLTCEYVNILGCSANDWNVKMNCYYDTRCRQIHFDDDPAHKSYKCGFFTNPKIQCNKRTCAAVKIASEYCQYDTLNLRCKIVLADTKCDDPSQNINSCLFKTKTENCEWDSDAMTCQLVTEEATKVCNDLINENMCTTVTTSIGEPVQACTFTYDVQRCSLIESVPNDYTCASYAGPNNTYNISACELITKLGEFCSYNATTRKCQTQVDLIVGCTNQGFNRGSCFSKTQGKCQWDTERRICEVIKKDISSYGCEDNINKVACLLVTKEACRWDVVLGVCKVYPVTPSTSCGDLQSALFQYNSQACVQTTLKSSFCYYDTVKQQCLTASGKVSFSDCKVFNFNVNSCLSKTTANCSWDAPTLTCNDYLDLSTTKCTEPINSIICLMVTTGRCQWDVVDVSCKTYIVTPQTKCSNLQSNKFYYNLNACIAITEDTSYCQYDQDSQTCLDVDQPEFTCSDFGLNVNTCLALTTEYCSWDEASNKCSKFEDISEEVCTDPISVEACVDVITSSCKWQAALNQCEMYTVASSITCGDLTDDRNQYNSKACVAILPKTSFCYYEAKSNQCLSVPAKVKYTECQQVDMNVNTCLALTTDQCSWDAKENICNTVANITNSKCTDPINNQICINIASSPCRWDLPSVSCKDYTVASNIKCSDLTSTQFNARACMSTTNFTSFCQYNKDSVSCQDVSDKTFSTCAQQSINKNVCLGLTTSQCQWDNTNLACGDLKNEVSTYDCTDPINKQTCVLISKQACEWYVAQQTCRVYTVNPTTSCSDLETDAFSYNPLACMAITNASSLCQYSSTKQQCLTLKSSTQLKTCSTAGININSCLALTTELCSWDITNLTCNSITDLTKNTCTDPINKKACINVTSAPCQWNQTTNRCQSVTITPDKQCADYNTGTNYVNRLVCISLTSKIMSDVTCCGKSAGDALDYCAYSQSTALCSLVSTKKEVYTTKYKSEKQEVLTEGLDDMDNPIIITTYITVQVPYQKCSCANQTFNTCDSSYNRQTCLELTQIACYFDAVEGCKVADGHYDTISCEDMNQYGCYLITTPNQLCMVDDTKLCGNIKVEAENDGNYYCLQPSLGSEAKTNQNVCSSVPSENVDTTTNACIWDSTLQRCLFTEATGIPCDFPGLNKKSCESNTNEGDACVFKEDLMQCKYSSDGLLSYKTCLEVMESGQTESLNKLCSMVTDEPCEVVEDVCTKITEFTGKTCDGLKTAFASKLACIQSEDDCSFSSQLSLCQTIEASVSTCLNLSKLSCTTKTTLNCIWIIKDTGSYCTEFQSTDLVNPNFELWEYVQDCSQISFQTCLAVKTKLPCQTDIKQSKCVDVIKNIADKCEDKKDFVNSIVCAQIEKTDQSCFNDYQTDEATGDFIDSVCASLPADIIQPCNQGGLNKKSCLESTWSTNEQGTTGQECMWISEKYNCVVTEDKYYINEETSYCSAFNKLSCPKVRSIKQQPCKWDEDTLTCVDVASIGTCESFQDTYYSQMSCALTTDISCRYNSTDYKCQVITESETSCTVKAINKLGCLTKTQDLYCLWDQDTLSCLTQKAPDLLVLECDAVLNIDGCINNPKLCKYEISTNLCSTVVVDANTTGDFVVDVAFKINLLACSQVTLADQYVAYDSTNRVCVALSLNDQQCASIGINKWGCLAKTNQQCQFLSDSSTCQTISELSGCDETYSWKACSQVVGKQCIFISNKCQEVDYVTVVTCDALSGSDVYTNKEACSNLDQSGQFCVFDVDNYKCKAVDANFSECNILGINKQACQVKTDDVCKFNTTKMRCDVEQRSNVYKCTDLVNFNNCLLITTDKQYCQFKDGQCQNLEILPETICPGDAVLVNKSVCRSIQKGGGPCTYNENSCMPSDGTESCTDPQINIDACINIQYEKSCIWSRDACRDAEPRTAKCNDSVNKGTCLKIVTKQQYCVWTEPAGGKVGHCDPLVIDSNSKCPAPTIFANQATCRNIPRGGGSCKWDTTNCIPSDGSEQCSNININVDGCVSISMASECIWQANVCDVADNSTALCKDYVNKGTCINIVTPLQRCVWKVASGDQPEGCYEFVIESDTPCPDTSTSVNLAVCRNIQRGGGACKFSTQNCVTADGTENCTDANINVDACVNITMSKQCIWTNNSCVVADFSKVLCTNHINKGACIKVTTPSAKCQWVEGPIQKCQDFLIDSATKCPSSSLFTNQAVCIKIPFGGGACKWNSQTCVVADGQEDCDNPNINIDGCIKISEDNSCIWEDGACKISDPNSNTCGQYINKGTCINITTDDQRCVWIEGEGVQVGHCEDFVIKDNTKCPLDQPVNIGVCKAIRYSGGTCKYQSPFCIHSDGKEDCTEPNLNIDGCILIQSPKTCTWQETFCTSANLETAKCIDYINKGTCIKLTTPAEYCQWKGGVCLQVSAAEQCSNFKDVNSERICQRAIGPCEYDASLASCLVVSEKKYPCSHPGLSKDACLNYTNDKQACFFDEENSNCYLPSELLVCKQAQSNEQCSGVKNTCHWDSQKEECVDIDGSQTNCNDLPTFVTKQVCQAAKITSDVNTCSFQGTASQFFKCVEEKPKSCVQSLDRNSCSKLSSMPCIWDPANKVCYLDFLTPESQSCDTLSSLVSLRTCVDLIRVGEYCQYDQNTCQFIHPEEANCQKSINYNTCISIYSEYSCVWIFADDKLSVPDQNDPTKNVEINYHKGTCQTVLNTFDQVCSPYLNLNACLGVVQQGQYCYWKGTTCDSIPQSSTQKITIFTFSQVNQNACTLVNSGEKSKYNPDQHGCSLFNLEVDDCRTPGLNKEACLSIKNGSCQWNSEQKICDNFYEASCTKQGLDKNDCESGDNGSCKWDNVKQICKNSAGNNGLTKCESIQLVNAMSCASIISEGLQCAYNAKKGQCQTLQPNQNCNDPGINKLACLTMTGVSCNWTQDRCVSFQVIQDFTKCDSIPSPVNPFTCAMVSYFKEICIYSSESGSCKRLTSLTDENCDSVGLNKNGCVSVEKQSCSFQDGKCTIIDTKDVSCLQIGFANQQTCASTVQRLDTCKFDSLNLKCSHTINNDICSQGGLNKQGCIQLDLCLWYDDTKQCACKSLDEANPRCQDITKSNACKKRSDCIFISLISKEESFTANVKFDLSKFDDTGDQGTCRALQCSDLEIRQTQISNVVVETEEKSKESQANQETVRYCQDNKNYLGEQCMAVSKTCKAVTSCQQIDIIELELYEDGCKTFSFNNIPCIQVENMQNCQPLVYYQDCPNLLVKEKCVENVSCVWEKTSCDQEQRCLKKECEDVKSQTTCNGIINGRTCYWLNSQCLGVDKCSEAEELGLGSSQESEYLCNLIQQGNLQCGWVQTSMNIQDQACSSTGCRYMGSSFNSCQGIQIRDQVCIYMEDFTCQSCEEIKDACQCAKRINFCSYDVKNKACQSVTCSSFNGSKSNCETRGGLIYPDMCTYNQKTKICSPHCSKYFSKTACQKGDQCAWLDNQKQCFFSPTPPSPPVFILPSQISGLLLKIEMILVAFILLL